VNKKQHHAEKAEFNVQHATETEQVWRVAEEYQ